MSAPALPHSIDDTLARQIVAFVQQLRGIELYKQPGVAETLDWARALLALDARVLAPDLVQHTLGALLKYQDDLARLRGGEAAQLLAQARLTAAAATPSP